MLEGLSEINLKTGALSTRKEAGLLHIQTVDESLFRTWGGRVTRMRLLLLLPRGLSGSCCIGWKVWWRWGGMMMCVWAMIMGGKEGLMVKGRAERLGGV